MPTKHPRLNVVLDSKIFLILNSLAKKENISMSLLARDLIREALETHEDICWNKIAESRDKVFSYKKALQHKNIWQ